MRHEVLPSPEDVGRWIDAVCELPVESQAACIRLAAEQNVERWKRWCGLRGLTDHADELLAAFDGWLIGETSDQEFGEVASALQQKLPDNLAETPDPSGGFAGWALSDIALVALDQCEDVHDDVVHTAICYAAAAHAGVGAEATGVKLERLSDAELQFLGQWWAQCCERFPILRKPGGVA